MGSNSSAQVDEVARPEMSSCYFFDAVNATAPKSPQILLLERNRRSSGTLRAKFAPTKFRMDAHRDRSIP